MAKDYSKSRNAGKLNSVAGKSEELATENEKVITIPLKNLRENPKNEKIFNMNRVDEIAQSIKETDYIEPLEVKDNQDGTYGIISGHTRYRALIKLGRQTVKCVVKNFEENEFHTKERRMLLAANIHNREMLPLDMARAMAEYESILIMEKVPGNKRELIAEYFHVSGSQVHKYMALLKLIPELQTLVDRKQIGYTSLSAAGALSIAEQTKIYQYILHQRNLYLLEHGHSECIKAEDNQIEPELLEACYGNLTRAVLAKAIECVKNHEEVSVKDIPGPGNSSTKTEEMKESSDLVEPEEKSEDSEAAIATEKTEKENLSVEKVENTTVKFLNQFENWLDCLADQYSKVTFDDNPERKKAVVGQYIILKQKIDDELDRLGALGV